MSNLFTEDTYEQAIIELFENMGYDHLYAPDFDRDYTSPLLDSILRDSLVRINRGLPVEAVDEALAKLKNFDTGSLLQKNMIFMDYLQNGITVKFFVKGEEQSSIVRCLSLSVERKSYRNVEILLLWQTKHIVGSMVLMRKSLCQRMKMVKRRHMR